MRVLPTTVALIVPGLQVEHVCSCTPPHVTLVCLRSFAAVYFVPIVCCCFSCCPPMCCSEGYSWAEDKEHCEEYGRMLNADPSKVSARAALMSMSAWSVCVLGP